MRNNIVFLLITAMVVALALGQPAISQSGDGIAADGAMAVGSEEGAESSTAPLTFSYVDWDASRDSCVAKADPINVDELFSVLSVLIKESDVSLFDDLRDLMLCRQIEYMNDRMCKVDNVAYEPFFTRDSEDAGKSLSKEEKLEIDKLLNKAEEYCLNNIFLISIMKDVKSIFGKSLEMAACSRFADQIDTGIDCESTFKIFMEALDKGDYESCNSLKKGAVRDICTLFTKMDVETAGKSGFFESDSSERARQYLSAFKILRQMPISRSDKAQPFSESLLHVAVEYEKNGNYCDTIYYERILPAFCRAKDLEARSAYELKEQTFMEKDHARKKLLEEEDKKAMEAYKKRLEKEAEEAKSNEEGSPKTTVESNEEKTEETDNQ